MIRFKCKCSHRFEVEDDQAGASLQCPGCGLLVDVPTLSDLPHLTEEGTYTLSELDEHPERDRLNTLYRSYTRDHVDVNTGEEIDLRDAPKQTADPMREVVADPKSMRPKYDPVTGELIRPLGVEGEGGELRSSGAGAEPIPVGRKLPRGIPVATPVVEYATAFAQSVPGGWTIALELLMPVNAAVMFFVSLAYLAGHVLLATAYLFFLNLPIAALLLSHYGNVIEDTGPDLKDELPRPLRHAEFLTDIWWPFFRMFASVVMCYAPAVWVLVKGLPPVLAIVLAGVGTVMLPAVMLTMTTSGSMLNLRLDRLLQVIGVCGWRHFVAAAMWTVAVALHLWTWIGVFFLADTMPKGSKWLVLNHPLVMFPMTAVAIYLMHWYCWYVGALYRRHQHEFKWVLQRHIPENRGKTVVTPFGPVRRKGREGRNPRYA